MKKLYLIVIMLFLLLTTASCNKNVDINLDGYIDSLMNDTKADVPSWNKEGYKGKWNYIDGVFLNSLMNVYKEKEDKKYLNFIINYVNYYINESGYFVNLVDPEKSGFTSGELDTICESKILFDLLEFTNDSRYEKAIEITYNELISITRAKNNINFSHKESYKYQVWLDGMYMYVPFYARYALKYDKPEIFDEITNQYKFIREKMYDNDKKLYYHANDTSKDIFWVNRETGNSKSFWLRSIGWYITSLVDVIEYFPKGDNQNYLINLLDEALDGLLNYIDNNSKMFYQVVDQGDKEFLIAAEYLKQLKNTKYKNKDGSYSDTMIKNYLESSGSSMVAYTLMKASRLGYIAEDKINLGKSIFEGIYKHSYKNNELNDICITAGLGPENRLYRDGTIEYYLAEPVGSNDAKGVGPFLMAYLEYKK